VFMTEGAQTVLLSQSAKTAKQPSLVDQRPLQTARKLAALASTAEERDLAHEALRLADYEVDLALGDALREAKEHPPELTPEQRELMARNFKAETVVKTDQELITRLTRQLASTPETNKDEVQDQIDVANNCARNTMPSRIPMPPRRTRLRAPTANTRRTISSRRFAPGSHCGERAACWHKPGRRRSMKCPSYRAPTKPSISG